MKALVCELCGSNDIVKTNGYFVCQHCETKYTVEEARKMLIEGTVEIQGSVTIDNSINVINYLKNARNAKEKEDWSEAEKFYNMVMQFEPDNIEAILYSSYSRAKASLLDENIHKRKDIFNIFIKCISLIGDKYDFQESNEVKNTIHSMSNDICKMISSKFVSNESMNRYGIVYSSDNEETYDLFIRVGLVFEESILKIIRRNDRAYLHQVLIDLYSALTDVDFTNYSAKEMYSEKIKAEKVKRDAILKSRNEVYWMQHYERKQELLQEYEQLKRQAENLPKSKLLQTLNTQLETLIKEQETTSFVFKYNKWNRLAISIIALNKEIDEQKKHYDPVLSPLYTRIDEIQTELTKER